MSTMYPGQFHARLAACKEYRNRNLELNALKSVISQAAELLVSIDEAELRSYLHSVEGKLEMIQATDETVRASVLELIGGLETLAAASSSRL